jgi:hypothetical protein
VRYHLALNYPNAIDWSTMSEGPTALERRQQASIATIPSDDEIRRCWRIGEALASSKVFPDVKSTAEAFAKILVGRDLGISSTQALMSIQFIKGRPAIAANLLATFVKRTPGYDFKVTSHDDEQCTIVFKVDGKREGLSIFTMADAVKAELVTEARGGDKVVFKRRPPASEGWEKYPKAMLFARALSQGVKWYMPDATGGIAVYAGDELQAATDALQLTEGVGSGESQGLDLGPKVEKVLARAAELGHEAIADRATAEITLGGRSPEMAVKWVAEKEVELDAFEANPPVEASAVEDVELAEDANDPERAEAARKVAEQLDKDAEACDADGEDEKAAELRAGAAQMREQADALEAGDGDGV